MSIQFYDKYSVKTVDLKYIDIYFTPEYGTSCEYSDNAEWECCVYKDLIYVYLKKSITYNNTTYYELITPYGYSGYNYSYKTTYDAFLPLFRKIAKDRNYVVEIVRQNPYINRHIQITNYDIVSSKTLYATNIVTFEEYYKNTLNNKKRNMYKKALKNNLVFRVTPLTRDILKSRFIELYNLTMNKVNAKPYYYFNEKYFESLEKINNTYLAEVADSTGNTVGSCILFMYENYIHYHLSCNNNSTNCITDFLLINIVKDFGVGKTVIMGCGVTENDKLSEFKCSLSNKTFTYNIYKNIINDFIYNEITNV
jgi:hypothetical protein